MKVIRRLRDLKRDDQSEQGYLAALERCNRAVEEHQRAVDETKNTTLDLMKVLFETGIVEPSIISGVLPGEVMVADLVQLMNELDR